MSREYLFSTPCLHEKPSRGIRRRSQCLNRSSARNFMPTAPPPSRDVALETRFFWVRFKKPITAALFLALISLNAFTGYRFYSDRRTAAESALLASAKSAQEYQQVI